MTRRSYTAAEKAEALELYRTDGPTIVEERLGIPKGTVSEWGKAAGIQTVRTEQTAAATETARVEWEHRRVALAHRMGAVAERALERSQEAIDAGKARDAQTYATTMAILADKAQLLTGAATSRSEHITSDIDAAVAELEKELAVRGSTRTPVEA
jgi:transposase-like protein